VKAEIVKLMEWDVLGKVPEDIYTPEQMKEAHDMIKAEIDKTPELDPIMWKVLRECSSELILYQGRYTRLSNLGRKEQAEALSNKFRVSSSFQYFLYFYTLTSKFFDFIQKFWSNVIFCPTTKNYANEVPCVRFCVEIEFVLGALKIDITHKCSCWLKRQK
jgi:hypothetical protein